MNIKAERLASLLFCALCALFTCFFALRYLLPVLLPFALAYLLALATKKTAEKLHQKTGVSEPLLRVLLLIFCILLLFFVFLFLGICLAREAEELLSRFDYDALFRSFAEKARAFLAGIDRGGVLLRALEALTAEASALIFSLLSGVVKGILAFLPRAIVFLLVTLVAALYFALDLHRVQVTFAELCPEGARLLIARISFAFKHFLLRYLRAYLLLSSLTFVLLLLGFLLMRERYAVLLAALLTLFDLLPVLGVGCALVPWALYLLAAGQGARGAFLLLLFAVLFITRQLSEPRLLGAEMGVHPLLALFLSYAGLSLFGFWGMIFLPVLAGILRSLLPKREEKKL